MVLGWQLGARQARSMFINAKDLCLVETEVQKARKNINMQEEHRQRKAKVEFKGSDHLAENQDPNLE